MGRLARTLTARLDKRDHRDLEELAALEDRSVGNVVRQAIVAFLDAKAREYRSRGAMEEYRSHVTVARLEHQQSVARTVRELSRGIR